MEDQRPGAPPGHADPLPSWPRRHRWSRVVRGRGDTIPPPLSLWTDRKKIGFIEFTATINPDTFCSLGDENTNSPLKTMTSHLDVRYVITGSLVRPAV